MNELSITIITLSERNDSKNVGITDKYNINMFPVEYSL